VSAGSESGATRIDSLQLRRANAPQRLRGGRTISGVRVIDAPLMERERELEALGRVLEVARSGDGAAAIVEGPPGIGKSRLLAAAATVASDLRVLWARASELEHDFPFGVVRQLFEPVLFAAVGEERERLLAGAGGLAERVLAGAANGEGAADAFAVLHGLYWFAANLSSSRPVLLLVDDAQWADAASLRWLCFLLRRLDGLSLALLLAVRTGEPSTDEALLDELLGEPALRAIRPAGLGEAGIARLIEQMLGSAADPEFVLACGRATAGNPFLLRELVSELREHGVPPTAVSAPRVAHLSSRGVGRAVRGRLRRLPPAGWELARAVAVLGDGCELAVAARLAGLDEPTAEAAADALAGVSIVEPSRPLGFVHPLVRASVYGDLGAGQRAAWHARAAQVLGDAGAAADRVAVHLLMARPSGDVSAVTALQRAAESAQKRGAPDVAVSYLRRALEEPPPRGLEPVLAYELGVAALSAGDPETAIEQLGKASRAHGETHVRLQAATALASALHIAQRREESVVVLTATIDDLPEREREQGLRLQAARWISATGNVEAWRRLRAAGDRFVVASTPPRTTGERLQLAVLAHDAVLAGTASEARELCLRALENGELLDDPGPESLGFWALPIVLLLAHAYEDATRVCTEVIDWARRRGSLPAFSIAVQLRAYASWQRGLLAEAEADATSALENPAAPGLPSWGHFALVNVLLQRGATSEAETVVQNAPPSPGSLRGLWYLQTRARLRVACKRPREALEDLRACDRLEREWRIHTPSYSNWRTDAAIVLQSVGRGDEARELAAEELERCRAFGAESPVGVALRTLGVLTHGERGIVLLNEAVAILASSAARLEYAGALVELGSALRRGGRRADAREPLRAGLEAARDCGAALLAARAHDELVAAGARPRRDPIESRSTLTASELRVARMAAEGMTNREIAQALFLTEKTIEVHLTRTYRKLEIKSRSQLPRALPSVAAPA
jgi:DNA-binding CsgD family transcriptional regulator